MASNSPAYWRKRAVGVRALAATMANIKSCRLLLNIAEVYDQLAAHAEQSLPARPCPVQKTSE